MNTREMRHQKKTPRSKVGKILEKNDSTFEGRSIQRIQLSAPPGGNCAIGIRNTMKEEKEDYPDYDDDPHRWGSRIYYEAGEILGPCIDLT